MLAGWVCRRKTVEDVRFQLMRLLLAGGLCDIQNAVLSEMDHFIGAVTAMRYAETSHGGLEKLEHEFPDLQRAFWWHSMTAIATQCEWTMNIGQRSAFERLTHPSCESLLRLQAVGPTDGPSCDMPAAQTDLMQVTGLTAVHLDLTLRDFCGAGLIVPKQRKLTVPELAALQAGAQFWPNHLGRRSPPPRGHGAVGTA